MEESKSEAHITSAAAFVEGGIQDACDDACSICLEAFCESDPSTEKSLFSHGVVLELPLQELCDPLQLQSFHVIKESDVNLFVECSIDVSEEFSVPNVLAANQPERSNQELLEAVERERSFRFNPSRNAAIFHHPTLGDFELQHLPMGTNDAELDERIIQHLAAAAAMGRARHIARREGMRNRSSIQGRPQFLVFSTHPNAPSTGPISSLVATQAEVQPAPTITVGTPSSPSRTVGEESLVSITPETSAQADQQSASASRSNVIFVNGQGNSVPVNNRRSPNQSSPNSQDRAGPSDFQSFSESLKSRFNAVSMRYRESISKSTRGWKERFFSRNTSMAGLGFEIRREVNDGSNATVLRTIEPVETRDNIASPTASSILEDGSNPESNNHQIVDAGVETPLTETSAQASCAASSASK
ncbi:hypothetical protein Golax_016449 [Gossypium laxum]|uniref:Uncharacterized protein n=2 Tax=Gossypium TaxID=3633 RepID=A0A7J8L7Y7_9ROSI|nr:hypothetical protein [Gossypium lobatum]MBA0704177.1 hypothetical protein [Gossypium laxum]